MEGQGELVGGRPGEERLTGSYNRIEGPCPLCRKTNWVRLLVPSGEVECEKCLSRWPGVRAYADKVDAAFGQGAYQRAVAAIVGSAAASGLLE